MATTTHHSRLATLLIDCPQGTFDDTLLFWSRALGRETKPTTEEAPRYRALETPAEESVDLIVQRMDDCEGGLHLDIETDDIEAEVTRLTALGARVKKRIKTWVVLEDPAGHAFCVIAADSRSWPKGAVGWQRTA
jgi:Glyoxalase-like domain